VLRRSNSPGLICPTVECRRCWLPEDALVSLDRLARATEPTTRRAAVEAMSHTVSSAAIPPLARALTDEDTDVQYWAVVGLRKATGQGGGMSREYFGAQRRALVAYWTTWARARGLIK
jgi:HEAT repeat protein